MSIKHSATFVISIDMELYWGLRNRRRLRDCRAELMAARRAVPRLLELFSDYDVRATWAPFGVLFCRDRGELLDHLPSLVPVYGRNESSPYAHIGEIGDDEGDDPCHYAPSLIARIGRSPGQEVGSHTFADFRCRNTGQTAEHFAADLKSAIEVARKRGIMVRSLVVAGNKLSGEYRHVCRRLGISAIRGAPTPWPYGGGDGMSFRSLQWVRRMIRAVDSVVPVTGTRCVRPGLPMAISPVDVSATRRWRPLIADSRWLADLQRRRIGRELDAAAHRGGLFHLWWSLRDLGRRSDAQIEALTRLLDRFDGWRRLGRMESVTMHEVVVGKEGMGPRDQRSSSRRTTSF